MSLLGSNLLLLLRRGMMVLLRRENQISTGVCKFNGFLEEKQAVEGLKQHISLKGMRAFMTRNDVNLRAAAFSFGRASSASLACSSEQPKRLPA